MTERLCLRCEWTGDSKGAVCPNCGATLFRPPDAPAPRRGRRVGKPRRPRARDTTPLAAPSAESFDPATPDEPDEAPPVGRRGGWIAGAVVLVVAIVAGVTIERATPPPPPTAPAPGLAGDLVFLGPEVEGRSRMWIWDLETGEARQGPSVKDAVQLVDAYAAEPGAGWVGVVSRDGDRQVAGLLRNFAPSDVPAPVLTGDLVAWTYDGAAVVAATKDVGTCTTLSVETVNLQVSSARARLDRRVCGDVTAVALAGKSPYFGLTQEVGVEVNKIWYGRITTWVRDGALVALGQHGATLVVPECGAADPETAPCGGLAYADPPSPGYVFMEEGVGALTHERFLGWARDGRTGYVLGTYGGVRGIYAARRIHQPQPPRLVVASDAQEVYVAEAYGATYGNLFISQDGALLLINTDGEQVPLTLPEGVPSPAGPIAWVTAVQEP